MLEEALACRFCRFAPHFYPGSRSKQLWERQHEPITSSMRTLSARCPQNPSSEAVSCIDVASCVANDATATERSSHGTSIDSSCRDPSGDGCSNTSSTCAKKNVAAALACPRHYSVDEFLHVWILGHFDSCNSMRDFGWTPQPQV